MPKIWWGQNFRFHIDNFSFAPFVMQYFEYVNDSITGYLLYEGNCYFNDAGGDKVFTPYDRYLPQVMTMTFSKMEDTPIMRESNKTTYRVIERGKYNVLYQS